MRLLAAVMLAMSIDAFSVSAQSAIDNEALVKAAFLINFAKFVQWPVGTTSARFVGCVLGDAAVLEALSLKSGTVIQGRPLRVRSADDIGDAHECQLLFIGKAVDTDPRVLGAALGRAAVLTVSDRAEDASTAIISFAPANGRLAFNINLTVARLARLEVSSQLLGVARHVSGVARNTP